MRQFHKGPCICLLSLTLKLTLNQARWNDYTGYTANTLTDTMTKIAKQLTYALKAQLTLETLLAMATHNLTYTVVTLLYHIFTSIT